MRQRFFESVATLPAVSQGDGVFDVTVITPGWGSSGYYSEEMIREYGPKVFTTSRAMFADHPTQAEMENGRSVEKIWAKIIEDARWDEASRSLKAKIKVPSPEKREFVENFMDTIGLSIHVEGNGSEGEAEGRTGVIVESLNPDDRYASLDFVVAAGRGGKVDRKLMESFRALEGGGGDSSTETSADRKETRHMDEKVVTDLTVAVTALVAEMKAAEAARLQEAAEAKAKAEAEKGSFDAFAAVEAVREAKLPESLHKRVVEAIKGGNEDYVALIEDAQSIAEDIRKESEEMIEGRFTESAGSGGKKDISKLGIFSIGKGDA